MSKLVIRRDSWGSVISMAYLDCNGKAVARADFKPNANRFYVFAIGAQGVWASSESEARSILETLKK